MKGAMGPWSGEGEHAHRVSGREEPWEAWDHGATEPCMSHWGLEGWSHEAMGAMGRTMEPWSHGAPWGGEGGEGTKVSDKVQGREAREPWGGMGPCMSHSGPEA